MPPRSPRTLPVLILVTALLGVSAGCTPSAGIGVDLPDTASDDALLACLGEGLDAMHAQGLDDWPTTPALRDRDGRGWLWRNAPGLDESPIRAAVRLYDRRLAFRIARDGLGGPRANADDPALATLRDALSPCITTAGTATEPAR